jgi:isoleucyl-tRNA synthetase
MKYGLPILNPVDAAGKFTAEAGPYAGMHIFKANAKIVEDLRTSGALWSDAQFEHSYPHCWRCHNPVIFRATAQWFIAMDQNLLRQRAMDAVDGVAYTPDWGRARQRQMIETHPEWCISRQRTWGTPIPAVICSSCNESILDPGVARAAAKRFGEVGASAWWSDPVETYLPARFACARCGGTTFEKEKNIVDIWFESGVSHLAVLGRDGLNWPSDVVLEGGDQYRGWFRSSLLTGVAIKGHAPYRHVVKNGWVNDEQGRAMSKSTGTGITADAAMEKWGADVLRLWTASVEFFDDVRFGPNVVDQVGRVYRNLRNRIRFMISNHDAYLQAVEFESAMSGLYFDALKDPLYSLGAASARRRSAQSALFYVLERFLVALAPILSFTTEEAWQSLPEALRGEAESVFDLSLGAPAEKPETRQADAALWERLRELRAQVAASESPRDFEARVTLKAPRDLYERLAALGDTLREALVVSQLDLQQFSGDAPVVEIAAAEGQKCARCWKFRELGIDPEHPTICADCAAVINTLGT